MNKNVLIFSLKQTRYPSFETRINKMQNVHNSANININEETISQYSPLLIVYLHIITGENIKFTNSMLPLKYRYKKKTNTGLKYFSVTHSLKYVH